MVFFNQDLASNRIYNCQRNKRKDSASELSPPGMGGGGVLDPCLGIGVPLGV